MNIAVTGATGFVGQYIARHLVASGNQLKCVARSPAARERLPDIEVEWVPGDMQNADSFGPWIDGCEAIVHAALGRPGKGFQGSEGDRIRFAETNLMGSLRLIEAAMNAGVRKFIFISSGAVYDRILTDRSLDEAHPRWPQSHYGAHKAAVEMFVHSYGWGLGFDICALRPTSVYGIADPVQASKWFPLIQSVVAGETVHCQRGSKVVHAADVARCVEILLGSSVTAGECYNCCDLYASEWMVAQMTKSICRSNATIVGEPTKPKHLMNTDKLCSLGMRFGGEPQLQSTIETCIRILA